MVRTNSDDSDLPELSPSILSLRDAMILEVSGSDAWRVCDSRCEAGEGRFLAFLEWRTDHVEVMQIADGFAWTAFETIAAALDYVAVTNGRVRAERRSVGSRRKD